MTLVAPSYQNVLPVNSSLNLSKKNSKLLFWAITSSLHIDLAKTWQLWRYFSIEHLTTLTLIGSTRLAHILRSLSCRRLLSTLVRPTEICLWEITFFKNFPHFHTVTNSFPSGTSELSELSSRSMMIDPSFLSNPWRSQILYSNHVVFQFLVTSYPKSLVVT